MKNKHAFLGAIAIVFAASLWAVDSAVLRPRLYHLDPFMVVFLEHAIAFAFMFPLLMRQIKEVRQLGYAEWGSFFWIAVFGGAIGTLAITKAFFSVFLDGVSSVSVIVLIQKLQPVFAIVLAYLILREKPRPAFYLWALGAIIGSYLVAFGFAVPDLSAEKSVIYVPLLALLAAFSFGSGTVFGKKALGKASFSVATYIRFGLTSLIMLALITSLGKWGGVSAFAAKDILTLLIIVFSTGGLAIFIYYWGLKRVSASKATIFELGFPVTAIILDYLIHKTVLSVGQWVGAGLIIFSIAMITRLKPFPVNHIVEKAKHMHT